MKKCLALIFATLLLSSTLIGCDKGTNTPVTSGDQQSAVTSESKDTVSTDDIITGTGTDDGAFNVEGNAPRFKSAEYKLNLYLRPRNLKYRIER